MPIRLVVIRAGKFAKGFVWYEDINASFYGDGLRCITPAGKVKYHTQVIRK